VESDGRAVGRPNAEETRISVVLIDDHDGTREVFETLLESAGFEVATAVDGEEGLRIIQSNDPDVVITDIAMPRLDGIAVARYVREHDRQRRRPLIAATAQSSGYEPALLNELFDVVLHKPVSPAALLAVIRELVA